MRHEKTLLNTDEQPRHEYQTERGMPYLDPKSALDFFGFESLGSAAIRAGLRRQWLDTEPEWGIEVDRHGV